VSRTGKPAPTVDSWKTIGYSSPGRWALRAWISLNKLRSPEKAFLFGVTMWRPCFNQVGYWEATNWLAVVSTRTAGLCLTKWAAKALRSGWFLQLAKTSFQVLRSIPGCSAVGSWSHKRSSSATAITANLSKPCFFWYSCTCLRNSEPM